MVDTRFHRFAGPVTLRTLLSQLGRVDLIERLPPADHLVTGVAELDLAESGDVALAAQSSYLEELRRTKAGAVFVAPALLEAVPPHTIAIALDKPHDLFASVLDTLYPASTRSIIASGREDLGAPIFERDVTLGTNVVVGAGVEIGRGTVIGANTVIGAGVTIGRNCVIAANSTIDCAHIGNDVVLHSGVRIGTEGFGWLDFGRSNRKIPQLGRVIIQDKVEVGANSTIDRGAMDDTVIGEGTKIDNLVQVGHNVRIGRHCVIVGQVAIAGSVTIGDQVMIGGGTTIAGHLQIGAGAQIAGMSAVAADVPGAARWGGIPARPMRAFLRDMAEIRARAFNRSSKNVGVEPDE